MSANTLASRQCPYRVGDQVRIRPDEPLYGGRAGSVRDASLVGHSLYLHLDLPATTTLPAATACVAARAVTLTLAAEDQS